MDSYVLGLDIGTTSIGWGCISDEKTGNGKRIFAAGVRVFPEGVDKDNVGNVKSRCAERREARLARRLHRRRGERKRGLKKLLVDNGFLPGGDSEWRKVIEKSPYPLRAQALDEKLERYEIGRIIYHLNQRRGFKSNRKGNKKEGKVVEAAITLLRGAMESACARTLGEYLAGLMEKPQDGDELLPRLRNRYTFRDMYQDEFEKIWQKQSQFYPDVLTGELKEKVHKTIFFQRPLKSMAEKIGFCDLEEGRRRCPKGDWQAQEFAMLGEINNLRIIGSREQTLSEEQWRKVYRELREKTVIKVEKLRKILGLLESEKLNVENARRKNISGNKAQAAVKSVLSKEQYQGLTTEFRDEIIESIQDMDDDKLREKAEKDWGFEEEQIEKLLKISLPSGYLNLSREAIGKILPYLEEGRAFSQAKEAAGYLPQPQSTKELLLQLPRLVELHDPVEQKKEKDVYPVQITNAVVKRALSEVRRVVNLITKEHGKPRRIVVELARDAKNNITRRNEILNENRKREKETEEIKAKLIAEFGLRDPKGQDVLKYRLWRECGEECPFTGRTISAAQLFSPEVQIEHVLPYSRSLDDSQMNKTLCFADENKIKGSRLPYEAYGSDPKRYEEIKQRATQFPYRKYQRFVQKEIKTDECIERQLNDTRYISREVVKYLRITFLDVRCGRGAVTAVLRHYWGLNTILNPQKDNKKSRDDHRHHAVDAIVIALTNAHYLRKLAYVKDPAQAEHKKMEPPWEGFRHDVEEAIKPITASHKVSKKVRGKLHEDTMMGHTGQTDKKGQSLYVHRKSLEALTANMVEQIRDPAIRDLVKSRCEADPETGKLKIPKNAFNEPLLMPSGVPVKRVRIVVPSNNAIPIEPHKYAEPGKNHHIEIFEYLDKKGKSKRDGCVVTLFEASRRLLNKEPIVSRRHPARPQAKFVMSLAINETARIYNEGENDEGKLYRVQKLSQNQQIFFRPINFAGDLKDISTLFSKCPSTLNGRKVVIDPLGREFPAND